MYSIRKVTIKDIKNIKAILTTWVKSSVTGEIIHDEIAEIIKNIENSIAGKNNYSYYVAQDDKGEAIGLIGMRPVDEKIKKYISDENSVELINLYLSSNHLGKGAGKMLYEHVMSKAKERNFREVIWASGPRHKHTAWEFYNKVSGVEPIFEEHFYGEGLTGAIWIVVLNSKI